MKVHTPNPRNGEPFAPKETIAYAEILKLAHEEGLKSIQTEILLQPSEENGRHCIVKATVETERGHYEGLGDADPGNVEDFLAPHLIRVAETRAKARALRDAVNVGVVSFEELDGASLPPGPSDPGSGAPAAPTASRSPRHSGNGAESRPRPTPSRTRPVAPRAPQAARPGNGSTELMSEAQRRYLFRIIAGQGYQREEAEERLKDLFQVERLGAVTKVAATKMIDQLLNPAPAGATRSGTPHL
jgi:hypothetical protein